MPNRRDIRIKPSFYSRHSAREKRMANNYSDRSGAFVIIFTLYIIINQLYYIIFPNVQSSYIDEIFALFLSYAAIQSFLAARELRLVAILFGFYAAISVLGNVVYRYGGVSQPWGAVVDIVLDAKPLIIFMAFYNFWQKSNNPSREMENVCKIILALALLNSVFCVHDLVEGKQSFFGKILEVRNGFYQPTGFQVGRVRSAALTMIGASFAFYFYLKNNSFLYAGVGVFLSLLVFLHQSAKEMGALIVIIPFLFSERSGRGGGKLVFIVSALLVFFMILLTPIGAFLVERISFFSGESGLDKARTQLVQRGVTIAYDHFPLGTGAGTFGSPPSYQMGYSEVYYQYGFDKIYGATPKNPNFLQDAFWGKILGQSGFVGTVLYVFLMKTVLSGSFQANNMLRSRLALPSCSVAILAVMTSTASSPFSEDFLGVILAVFAAFGLSVSMSIAKAKKRPAQ